MPPRIRYLRQQHWTEQPARQRPRNLRRLLSKAVPTARAAPHSSGTAGAAGPPGVAGRPGPPGPPGASGAPAGLSTTTAAPWLSYTINKSRLAFTPNATCTVTGWSNPNDAQASPVNALILPAGGFEVLVQVTVLWAPYNASSAVLFVRHQGKVVATTSIAHKGDGSPASQTLTAFAIVSATEKGTEISLDMVYTGATHMALDPSGGGTRNRFYVKQIY